MSAESVASAPQEPAKTTSEESVASMSVQPETSNSEQSTTNSSDEAMRVIALDNVFGSIPDITDEEKSLVDAFAHAKRFRAFFGHAREKQKNLTRFRSSYRQQSTASADDDDADSDDEEHLELWNPVNVNWPADDLQSQILVNDNKHVLVQTSVLSRFGWKPYRRIIRQHGPIKIDAIGFGRKAVNCLIQFISGEHQSPIEWLVTLSPTAQLDLAMLSYHLHIPALQAVLMDVLARFLLDDGSFPDYWMMIYVWSLSHPQDPLRRLLLASFYLHIVVIGTDFKISNPDKRLKIHDYGEGMWLAELHRLLESNLDYEKFAGAEDDFIPHARRALWYKAWNTGIMEEKSHWGGYILGIVRDARERGCFDEANIFFFVNPSGDADLSTRLQTLADQRYLIHNSDESMELPLRIDEELAESDDEVSEPGSTNDGRDEHKENSRRWDEAIPIPTEDRENICSSKRKHSEVEPVADALTYSRPIKSSRLHRSAASDIMIHGQNGARLRVLRKELVPLSRNVKRATERQPSILTIRFQHINVGGLKDFLRVTQELENLEARVKEMINGSTRALLDLIITTEELDSPVVESRLISVLRPMFERKTMNIETAKYVFEKTRSMKSELRNFVAECFHWVLMKKEMMSLGELYTMCHTTGKLGVHMQEKLMALHEVWHPKMLAAKVVVVEEEVEEEEDGEKLTKVEEGKDKPSEKARISGKQRKVEYTAGWDSEHPCSGMAWEGAMSGSLD